ncbi:MAG: OmpA family protein [Myxococcota bacterium]
MRLWLGLLVVGLAAPSVAEAQLDDLRLRGGLTVGSLVSPDQRGWLRYDGLGFGGHVDVGYAVMEPLTLDVRLAGAYFLSEEGAGGLAEAGIGASLDLEAPAWLRWGPFFHVNMGWTGEYVRPTIDVGLRVGVVVTDAVSVGIELSYHQLFFEDGENHSSDARFFMGGLQFAWRHPPVPEEPPAEVVTRERVVVREVPIDNFLRERTPPPEAAMPEDIDHLLDDALPITRREQQTLIPPVLFVFDSVQMLPCGEVALHAAREVILESEDVVVIAGHADGTGEDGYNDELSLRRATRVRDWLVAHGVPSERLRVEAYGESELLEQEETDVHRQLNRRATFRVTRVLSEGEASFPGLSSSFRCEVGDEAASHDSEPEPTADEGTSDTEEIQP